MSGRIQNTNRIENNIEEKLKKYPIILTDYYYSMTDNTATTKNAYIRYISDYLEFLVSEGYDIYDVSIFNKMTFNDLNRYVNYIRYTKNNGTTIENKESIRRARIAGIKSFYSYLMNSCIINKNPCEKIKMPKLNQEINVVSMTEDEVNHVKERIRITGGKWAERDLLIFTLGCRTGLRVTALCEIDIEDIDFNNKKLTVVEKGNRKREMFLGDDTITMIRAWIKDRGDIPGCNALFVSNRKTRITTRTVERMIARYTDDIDKHITPHKMRSTCGTLFYEKTGDVYLVANQLGHKNIANTMRYTRISENEKKRAANILDVI